MLPSQTVANKRSYQNTNDTGQRYHFIMRPTGLTEDHLVGSRELILKAAPTHYKHRSQYNRSNKRNKQNANVLGKDDALNLLYFVIDFRSYKQKVPVLNLIGEHCVYDIMYLK